MYILNKKTGVVQECGNSDVIKTCQKHPDQYDVQESREDIRQRVQESAGNSEEKTLEKMTVPELKALAKEKGIEGAESLKKEELLAVLKDVILDD